MKFSRIFRDAKNAAKSDIEAGKFGAAAKASPSSKSDSSPQAGTLAAVEKAAEATEESGPSMTAIPDQLPEAYTAKSGSTIVATLIGYMDEDEAFVFENGAGKQITVTGDKLSVASLQKVRAQLAQALEN